MSQLRLQQQSPFHYLLSLVSHAEKGRKVQTIRVVGKEQKSFDALVRQSKCPKIYIICNAAREVLYVGYADQHMGSRLRYGLNPDTRNGYHGYKWKAPGNGRVTSMGV